MVAGRVRDKDLMMRDHQWFRDEDAWVRKEGFWGRKSRDVLSVEDIVREMRGEFIPGLVVGQMSYDVCLGHGRVEPASLIFLHLLQMPCHLYVHPAKSFYFCLQYKVSHVP